MNNQFQLQIEEPCHEQWDKMNPVEKGRFCSSCAKKVIDFSSTEKENIVRFLSESNGEVCGRVPVTMLDQPVKLSDGDKQKLGRFVLALLLTFGSFLFASAQSTPYVKGKMLIVEPDTLSLKDSLVNNQPLPMVDTLTELGEIEGKDVFHIDPVIMGMIRYVPNPEIIMEEPKAIKPD